jgi:hypothetical protein
MILGFSIGFLILWLFAVIVNATHHSSKDYWENYYRKDSYNKQVIVTETRVPVIDLKREFRTNSIDFTNFRDQILMDNARKIGSDLFNNGFINYEIIEPPNYYGVMDPFDEVILRFKLKVVKPIK